MFQNPIYRVFVSKIHKIMGSQNHCNKKSVDNLFTALDKLVTNIWVTKKALFSSVLPAQLGV